MSQTDTPGLRLAELLASLSLAIDLALGQPMESLLRICLLAVGLGKKLCVSEQDLLDIYYLALIQYLSHDEKVIQSLIEWIGWGSRVPQALGQIYERWDGKGSPNKLKGEAILLPLRVVRIAQDAQMYHRLEETEIICAVLQKLAGDIYDPQIVECFCEHANHLFEETRASSPWDAVLAAEPGNSRCIPQASLDDVLRAVADFIDVKLQSPTGHSREVAELAGGAAKYCGLSE